MRECTIQQYVQLSSPLTESLFVKLKSYTHPTAFSLFSTQSLTTNTSHTHTHTPRDSPHPRVSQEWSQSEHRVTGCWAARWCKANAIRLALCYFTYVSSELIPVVARGRVPFLRLNNASLDVHNNFIYLFTYQETFGLLCLWAIINTTAIKMGGQILLWYQAFWYLGVNCWVS